MDDLSSMLALRSVADQLYGADAPVFTEDHPLAGLQVRISAAGHAFKPGHTKGVPASGGTPSTPTEVAHHKATVAKEEASKAEFLAKHHADQAGAHAALAEYHSKQTLAGGGVEHAAKAQEHAAEAEKHATEAHKHAPDSQHDYAALEHQAQAGGHAEAAAAHVSGPLAGAAPKFRDAAHADEWLAGKHPGTKFSLQGMHESQVQVNAEQYHKLAAEHSWAAQNVKNLSLKSAATFAHDGKESFAAESPYAHEVDRGRGHKDIELNKVHYSQPTSVMKSELAEQKKSGWGATHQVESILTHEFGHVVQDGLRDHANTHGLWAKSKLRDWENKNFAKKKDRASEYGKSNHEEGWAESFAQMHHSPRSEWAPSTHRVAALVEHFNKNDPAHSASWDRMPK